MAVITWPKKHHPDSSPERASVRRIVWECPDTPTHMWYNLTAGGVERVHFKGKVQPKQDICWGQTFRPFRPIS